MEHPKHLVERASGEKVYTRAWRAPLLGRKSMRVALVVDPMRATREQLEFEMRKVTGWVPSSTRCSLFL